MYRIDDVIAFIQKMEHVPKMRKDMFIDQSKTLVAEGYTCRDLREDRRTDDYIIEFIKDKGLHRLVIPMEEGKHL